MSVGTCPYGGQWWSCPDQSPTFEGCCSTYPCQGDNTGCPDDDLYPVVFASAAATTTTISSASTSSSSQSLTTSRSTTTSTSSSQTKSFTTSPSSSRTTAVAASLISLPTSTPIPTPTPSSSPSPSRSLSKTQIIGGSVGGGVLVFLLCALFSSWYRSKMSRRAHICQLPVRPASQSPSPPEISERQSPQPSQRTLLPYLQTNLSNAPQRQRTRSSYSAYSPYHITSSIFDSPYSSGEQLVSSGGSRTCHSEEAYYPGQPVFGVPLVNNPPEAVAQPRRSLPFEHQRPEVIAQPRISLPSEHQRPSPETVPQPRRSPLSQYQRSSPDPVYVSRQHYCTSPISPTMPPTGAPNSERRSSVQQYESRRRPQLTVPTMQPDRSLGLRDLRRRSEPAPVQYIYETPDSVGDRVAELPLLLKAGLPQRPIETRGLRVKTMSGSAVGASAVQGGRRWGPSSAGPTMESINAAGPSPGRWGGDMRTSWEKERDLLRERERERVARTSYTRLQVVNP